MRQFNKLLDIKTKGTLLCIFPLMTNRFTEGGKNLHKRKQRQFEQKETKLAKVGHLSSGRLFFRIRLPPSLESPCDFKTPISTKDYDIASARVA
jgi:hypothetical protein